MRITRAADIGLRALMVLASGDGRRTTLAALAHDLAVPERHLGKVVQRLAREGWIDTARGRGGGIAISDAGRQAAASDVLIAIEGQAPVVNCDDPPCPLRSSCRLRSALGAAQRAFMAELARSTVDDLAGPSIR